MSLPRRYRKSRLSRLFPLRLSLCRGVCLAPLLFEPLDAAGRIHQLLLARVVRVADGADIDSYIALGAARHELVAARTMNLGDVILWMNALFHTALTLRNSDHRPSNIAGA